MSLVCLALRLCLVKALSGRTLAENRVFDSLIVPWDQVAQETGPQPVLIVSTDQDDAEPDKESSRDMTRDLDVVIEMTLAGQVQVRAGELEVEIPHTDAGLEATLDVMAWQVEQALKDPTDPWAEMFRVFRGPPRPKRLTSRCGGSAERGVKYAVRQNIVTIDPMQEPERGADAIPEPWDAFVALLRTDPALARYGDLLESLLTGSTLLPWQRAQALLQQTRGVMNGVGLGAVPGAEAEPPASQITIETVRGDLVETQEAP
ncbi:hypothetical protein [Methylobacterium sp. WSM2598]|uniref:hypothetical protein n=1 Tax=Methylobacterium sp. WSM2598 TaxID=398261 RepID=UPI00038131B4|nr:hypothetical protein [Methylobacterium sp. WSM2598]